MLFQYFIDKDFYLIPMSSLKGNSVLKNTGQKNHSRAQLSFNCQNWYFCEPVGVNLYFYLKVANLLLLFVARLHEP